MEKKTKLNFIMMINLMLENYKNTDRLIQKIRIKSKKINSKCPSLKFKGSYQNQSSNKK